MKKSRRSPRPVHRPSLFPVVGIGASAGGFEAFTQFLAELPLDTGMAFVLVQHLDPHHQSQLTELLARATKLPVHEVRDRVKLKPDHVYVIPPNKTMQLSAGQLRLRPRSPHEHALPVDAFLRSLAEQRGNRAIAVILSGTASDGAEGVRAVKLGGGLTFAQDEKSAKYAGMPHAAVMTGCVDRVLPPEAIAQELAHVSRHPYVHDAPLEAREAFPRIMQALRLANGVDFTHYKPNTIQRRIERRMAVHRLAKLAQYADFLKEHPGETQALFEDLLINVTEFFRDPPVFQMLKKRVFPRLVRDRSAQEAIRVWVPGCSTGEEVYSLAMVLLEFLGDRHGHIPLQFFATDISEKALDRARRGFYPESIREDVSPARLRRHFVKVSGGYQISKGIRERCVFAKQNLTKDPPFSNLDLISCRNLLIYLGPPLQKRVMPVFHYALKPQGHLLLGTSESITGFENLFAVVDKTHRLFGKKMTAVRPTFDFAFSELVDEPVRPRLTAPGTPRELDVQREADRLLLSRFAPASVLVNDDLEILQFRGHTGVYLEPAAGAASLNLLKMAREGMLLELRAGIAKARQRNSSVRREGLRVKTNGDFKLTNVEILPLKVPGTRERYFMILFEEARPAPAPATPPVKLSKAVADQRVARAEQELGATKEYMQSVVEELESANEELKAANEEIQSSNEELQSTNEELETAKEELQSTNEELTTVNEELQTRNSELGMLNSDLLNLLVSVNIPILMLGADLRIRRMTPQAEKVLHLLPADMGRVVTDLRLPVVVPDLAELIKDAVANLTVREREVQTADGCWYSLRIRPYRTVDNKIDGAVLAFVDINALKQSLDETQHCRRYAEGIVETMRKPLLVLEADLRVRSANSEFYNFFKETKAATEQRFIYDLGNGQWNIPALRRLLEEVLPKQSHFEDFEVTHEFPRIGPRVMVLNGRQLERADADGKLILLALEDITERRNLQRTILDISEGERERLGRDVHDGLGQQLTGIAFLTEALRDRLAGHGSPETANAEQIVKRTAQAIKMTHNLARGLYPVQLGSDGICAALEELALNVKELSRLECRVECDHTLRLSDANVVRHLYRIAQEAVNNALKHSGGKRILLKLATKDRRVTLTVKDDGRGLGPPAKHRTGGMGLQIMNYRARIIGATLDVRSTRRGTTLVCTLPLTRKGKAAVVKP